MLRKAILGIITVLSLLNPQQVFGQGLDSILAEVGLDKEMVKQDDSPNDPIDVEREEHFSTSVIDVSTVGISGFFDVLLSDNRSASDRRQFNLGQAEVDLESAVGSRSSVLVGIAYNSETGAFELGCAELSTNMYSSKGGIPISIDITAGQFDVPFGIDYRFYAATDRRLVTAPWFFETHGDGWRGWNDFGVHLDVSYGKVNVTGFWVNGFESSALVTERITNLATGLLEDVVTEINTTPADAFGFRLGAFPVLNLEVGVSYGTGINESNKSEMLLGGADLQYTISDFAVRAEYVIHSVNRSVLEETHRGYYLQPTYTLGKMFFTVRYSAFEPEGMDWKAQSTIGAGYTVDNGVELRVENTFVSSSIEDKLTLQLLAAF